VCVYIHTYMSTFKHTRVSIYILVQIYLHVFVYVHIFPHISIDALTRIFLYLSTRRISFSSDDEIASVLAPPAGSPAELVQRYPVRVSWWSFRGKQDRSVVLSRCGVALPSGLSTTRKWI